MNEKLIQKLRNGEIAVKNDGTKEEVIEVTKYAFPKDKFINTGNAKHYFRSESNDIEWDCSSNTALPSHSVKEFLKPNNEYPKVMKVSDYPIKTMRDFMEEENRVVFMEKNNKFLAWSNAKTLEEAEKVNDVIICNYAVDLDWKPEESKPLKLTLKQIAEKFNVEKIEIINYEI